MSTLNETQQTIFDTYLSKVDATLIGITEVLDPGPEGGDFTTRSGVDYTLPPGHVLVIARVRQKERNRIMTVELTAEGQVRPFTPSTRN